MFLESHVHIYGCAYPGPYPCSRKTWEGLKLLPWLTRSLCASKMEWLRQSCKLPGECWKSASIHTQSPLARLGDFYSRHLRISVQLRLATGANQVVVILVKVYKLYRISLRKGLNISIVITKNFEEGKESWFFSIATLYYLKCRFQQKIVSDAKYGS